MTPPIGYFWSGEQLPAPQGAAAQAADNPTHTIIHEPLALNLAVGGDVLPIAAAALGLVESVANAGLAGAPTVARAAADSVAAVAVGFTLALGGGGDELVEQPAATIVSEAEYHFTLPPTDEPPVAVVFAEPDTLVEQPSLPIGADETGYLPPVPPPPGPVFGIVEDTDELVEQPAGAVPVDYPLTQTIVHESLGIDLRFGGEVWPSGAAPPSQLKDETGDIFALTDPVVARSPVPWIYWLDRVVPDGGIDVDQQDDIGYLTAPIVETVTDARVFTDQEILPGAVAPTQLGEQPDPLALTDPVVEVTTRPSVFAADEVLPTVGPGVVDYGDPLALTDPVVERVVTPVAPTDDEVLPGAVAPEQVAGYGDPLALTNPIVHTTVTPVVFIYDEVLPGAYAPVSDYGNPLALTAPTVVQVVVPQVFSADEELAAPPTIGVAEQHDPAALTTPPPPPLVVPHVFTDTEVVAPVVGPGLHDEGGDPLALTDPVVLTTTSRALFTSAEVIPQPIAEAIVADEYDPLALLYPPIVTTVTPVAFEAGQWLRAPRRPCTIVLVSQVRRSAALASAVQRAAALTSTVTRKLELTSGGCATGETVPTDAFNTGFDDGFS